MSNEISVLVNSTRDQFLSRQVSNDISFEAEAGFAIQLLSSDFARNTALNNRQSVIDAVTNVSAIGISLNPAKKQAYLVPRDGKICLDISYMGLIDLAVATGSILWAQCLIVYENDEFELQGYDRPPHHKFNPFSRNRGPIVGAYATVKTPSGDYLTHAMPITDIFSIRDRSQSWKSGKSSPWKSDEGEMIKKTVIKQAYKYWPKTSPQLENAIHYLNTDSGEGLAEINKPARMTGTAAAESARQAQREQAMETIDEAALIARLEPIAEQGVEAYQEAYARLTKDERQAINASGEHARLKKIASSLQGEIHE